MLLFITIFLKKGIFMSEWIEKEIDRKYHEVSNLFPLMDKDDYEELRKDIKKNGLLEPIWLYQEEIIDGRNRHRACIETEIEPKFKDWNGEGSLVNFVVSLNLKRRHLTTGQRAAIAVDILPLLEKEAKERQGTHKEGDIYLDEIFHQGKRAPQSTEHASKILDTNSHYVSDAKRLSEDASDLFDKVKSGELTIPQAKKELKRREVLDDLEDIKKKEIKAIEGVYDVVVIDPPWDMKKIERDVAPNQVEFDYPTMTDEEIMNLEIPCDDNCHVWLWTTHKKLPFAFQLLEAWGLKYVCTFVWHKNGGFQPFGLPQYNCEFALYARKGTPQFIDFKDFMVCFNAQRKSHSEKPEEFYNVLRRVTAGRRIDMFNRREIEGFDVWGNES
jgi:N6-adenosine-specific RNA methylase IME4